MSARCVTIHLPHLLRDVRATPPPRAEDDREQAAYEQGRLDGEKALN